MNAFYHIGEGRKSTQMNYLVVNTTEETELDRFQRLEHATNPVTYRYKTEPYIGASTNGRFVHVVGCGRIGISGKPCTTVVYKELLI